MKKISSIKNIMANRYIAIAVVIITAIAVSVTVYSLDYPPQPSPEMLEIYPIHEQQPAIGYNEFDEYYADLRWSPLVEPNPPEVADRQYINFYLQKVNRPYKPSTGIELKEEGIPGSETQLRMNSLESGTVYYVYATAYYTDMEGGEVVYTSLDSLPSNTVKFLTDIDVAAVPSGPNEILISWDDVWNSGGRINYKLYVSESGDFSNTPPIYITNDLVGPGRPVSVNETTGELEYAYTVSDSGRVYYIKVEPDIQDESLKMPEESKVVRVSSYIIARTVRMATNDMGTIWKMEWSPVITGLDSSQVEISYHIYRGITGSSELPQYVAQTDDTNFFITMQDTDPEYYFIIRAMVTADGQDLYPGLKIESMRIEVKESEVPSNPAAPEIVNSVLNNYGDEIASYEEELEATSATVFWRPPREGTGELDTDVSYDIWLLTDPAHLDNPPEGLRIETSLEIDESRQVLDGSVIKAYKYGVEGLQPNNVYYFVVQARKEFVDYVDGILQNVVYRSEPSLKVVITPAEGSIEQPVVPGRPPLTIKKGPPPGNEPAVSEDTAVIRMKNKWYERYNGEEKKWEHVSVEELDSIDETLVGRLESGEYEGNEFRIVYYDQGVTLDIGCIPYSGDISPEDLEGIPADRMTAFPAVPNDPHEDPGLNPDGQPHNIDIAVTGLEPNTTYIVWARAARLSAELVSGPSDPLVFTTDPEVIILPEKPIVPEFNYSYPGDTYVDLGWDFRQGYNYYIRHATIDDINSASEALAVTPEDLASRTYYRVTGLEQDTIYHFWIQAETVSGDDTGMRSEWSSSLVTRTLPYIPPETPGGFGIKSTDDAITKQSISFEWITIEGLEYILEVSDNIDYENATRYNAATASEFIVDGLRSNYRYYARLYAYDPEKEMESEPTASISVKTLKSDDEYDADRDIETYPSGDIIKKDAVAHMNMWTIRITGLDADRFVEYAREKGPGDITVDLNEEPEGTLRIRLLASGRVFEALSDFGKALVLDMPESDYVFRPGCFDDCIEPGRGGTGKSMFEILIAPGEGNVATPESVTPVTEPSLLQVKVVAQGGGYRDVEEFTLPVRVVFTDREYHTNLKGLYYNSARKEWRETGLSYGQDRFTLQRAVLMEADGSGTFLLGNENRDLYTDIAGHVFRDSIKRIAMEYELKSISGQSFHPDRKVSLEEAVKLSFDVWGVGYELNPAATAVKAGILDISDMEASYLACTREKALDMVVRMYESVTNTEVSENLHDINVFGDLENVTEHMAGNVAFAINNGLVANTGSNRLMPHESITRGELAFLLDRYLMLLNSTNW